ncbi:MAG TPA: alpha/beta fold hydrolase, partial [Polyangiaceae bacterium]
MTSASSRQKASAIRRRSAGILAGAMALGCAASGEPPTEAAVNVDALKWTACDITTSSGTFENGAECSSLTVPVRREVKRGRTLTLSLKRFKRTSEPRGQLWLLAGGPGAAASDLEYDADTYFGIGSDLELYFLDHRGTGRSTRLACDVEEDPTGPSGTLIRDAEWTACAERISDEWGDDLTGFSTTEAARDLGEAIARTRKANQPVFVYAVSYGTYLAERYLQLFPNQSNGVILDSIAPPGHVDVLLEYDRQF